MKISKKQIFVIAGVSSAIAFSAIYVWKVYKRVKSEMESAPEIVEDPLPTELGANEDFLAEEPITMVDGNLVVQGELRDGDRITATPWTPVADDEVQRILNLYDGELRDGDSIISNIEVEEAIAADIDLEQRYYEIEAEERLSPLKYDKNSPEAWDQYKDYVMGGIDCGPTRYRRTRDLTGILFRYDFRPVFSWDEIIVDHILENRINFFGEDSIYCTELFRPTMAEMFVHFAELAMNDADKDVAETLNMFYENLGLYAANTQTEVDSILDLLMTYHYFYVGDDGIERYGMFGATDMVRGTGENLSLFKQYNYWIYSVL